MLAVPQDCTVQAILVFPSPPTPSPSLGLGFTGPHDLILSWFILPSPLPVHPLGGVLFLQLPKCGDPWDARPQPLLFSFYSVCGQIIHSYGFNYHAMLTTLEMQPQPRPMCPTAYWTAPPNIPRACKTQSSLPS